MEPPRTVGSASLQSFLSTPPTLHVIKSTVIQEDNSDVVLHTLKLESNGWTWYTTFHWAQVKSLQTSLTTWPIRRLFARQASTPIENQHQHQHVTHSRTDSLASPARSIRSEMIEEHTPRTARSVRIEGVGSYSDATGKKNRKFRLPNLNDSLASKTDSLSLSSQRTMYELYFRSVVDNPVCRTCPELQELLHISATSFVERQGPSWREGYLTVRWWAHADEEASGPGTMDEAEDRVKTTSVLPKAVLRPGVRRWAVLKNSFVALYKTREDLLPEATLLLDTDTVLQGSLFEHGHRLVLVNSVWRFELKARDRLDQRQWEAAVRAVLARSPWVERNRFTYTRRPSLSTGEEEPCLGQWYVDGEAAYKAMYTAITAARSQVFIAGLWVSPDLHLLRPPRKHPNSRLDRLLEHKARQGVQVYVLVFKEGPGGMTTNSKYTKARLNALDHQGRLHVIRCGNDLFPHLWCHHESIVCVDQEVSFVGSVGLGLGKYDTARHEMRDDQAVAKEQMWPGADYSNPRVKDFISIGTCFNDLPGHNRSLVPRMPMHGVHCAVTGSAAMDVCWHFINRWNLARYRVGKESKLPTIVPLGLHTLDPQSSSSGSSKSSSVAVVNESLGGYHHHPHAPAAAASSSLTIQTLDADDGEASADRQPAASDVSSRQLGVTRKTIARLVFGGSSSVSELPLRPEASQIFATGSTTSTSQGPAAAGSGANPVGIAEVASSKMKEALKSRRERNRQRLLELQHDVGLQSSELAFQSLTEVPEQPAGSGGGGGALEWMEGLGVGYGGRGLLGEDDDSMGGSRFENGRGGGESKDARYAGGRLWGPEEDEEEGREGKELPPSVGPVSQCRCRVVRSMGQWSGGYRDKQASILEAYECLIETAKHHVYIESPAFISGMQGDGVVSNRLAEVLVNRILRAHHEDQPFRVVMVLPLLPVFEGASQGAPLSSLTGAFFWQHRTLKGMLDRLSGQVPQLGEYLMVLGLRGHARMSEHYDDYEQEEERDSCFVTEQIYVDSRVMVVDDKRAIIGSAALNDRSLVGSRDSELCVVVEDVQTVSSYMAGRPYSAGEFCHSLRRRLWAEHLGLSEDDDRTIDPVAPQTWDLLRITSSSNTAIFHHTFPKALPSDCIRSLPTLKQVAINGMVPRHPEVTRVLGDGAAEACKDDQQRAHWLAQLQGHVVTYPLHFLSDDMAALQPAMVLADIST